MKVITFREDGEKVRLRDLVPGTLFEHNGCIALKSEYQTNRGLIEAAIVDSGEQFWGGAKTVQEQRELLVQPFVLAEDEEAPAVDAVVLPCKLGTTLYRICEEGRGRKPFIREVTFNRTNFARIVLDNEVGRTVFLAREEAEAALAKMKGLEVGA